MKRLIISCLGMCLTVLFAAAPYAGVKDAKAGKTECYYTPEIGVTEFVFQDKIFPVKMGCKEGYYINEITQSPETDPKTNGQFVIISTIKCCRVTSVKK